MARTLPPMMQVMKDIGGVEIPETLANLAGERKEPAAMSDRISPDGK
jgi:flotillin